MLAEFPSNFKELLDSQDFTVKQKQQLIGASVGMLLGNLVIKPAQHVQYSYLLMRLMKRK